MQNKLIRVTLWPSLNAKQEGKDLEIAFGDLVEQLSGPASYLGKWRHPGWSPGRFEPLLRCSANVQEMFLLGLDYDSNSNATVESACFYWSGVSGFIYTTKSHTQETNRFRLMLQLSRPVNANEYNRLWLLVKSMLLEHGHVIDPQAGDASRFWYGPGTVDGTQHQTILLDGAPFDVEAALEAAPPIEAAHNADCGDVDTDVDASRLEEARNYLARMPAALSGHSGHPTTFRAAVALVRGFGLSRRQANEVLWNDYNPRCVPMWSSKEIEHKVEDAYSNSMRAWGYLLDRPTIRLGTDIFRVANEATAALVKARCFFQSSGKLVRIVRVEASDEDIFRLTAGTPQIDVISSVVLNGTLSEVANWEGWDGRAKAWMPKEPGKSAVALVYELMEWPGIPTIAGITEVPIMRPDGSIASTPGFDEKTKFVYLPSGHFEPVAENPSRADAVKALEELLEVWCDFPFKTPADRFVPIAATLALVARPAIRGNVPLFAFDAPQAGSGKTTAIDAVSIIAMGRESYKFGWAKSEEELEKRLSAYTRQHASLINFDNVRGSPICGMALEQALTSNGSVALRVLGSSDIEEHAWRAVVFASGNQIRIEGDMPRRTVICRMVPKEDKPAERTGFRHDPLLIWVRQERERLVDAALTLLRAYVVAGQPDQQIGTRGNFERFVALAASAIVWAGGANILECWDNQTNDNEDTYWHEVLISWWEERWKDGATCREVLNDLKLAVVGSNNAFRKTEVNEAVQHLCGLSDAQPITARALGFVMRTLREVYLGGRFFDVAKTGAEGKVWIVNRVKDTTEPADSALKNQS